MAVTKRLLFCCMMWAWAFAGVAPEHSIPLPQSAAPQIEAPMLVASQASTTIKNKKRPAHKATKQKGRRKVRLPRIQLPKIQLPKFRSNKKQAEEETLLMLLVFLGFGVIAFGIVSTVLLIIGGFSSSATTVFVISAILGWLLAILYFAVYLSLRNMHFHW